MRNALNDMVEDRLLLCEDAAAEETRLLQAGVTRGVPLQPGAVVPTASLLPACEPKKHHGKHDDDDDDDD